MKETHGSRSSPSLAARWTLGVIALAGVLALGSGEPAEARVVHFGTETEVIPILYGGATLFRFPLEVRTISQAQKFQIGPADPEQPNYALLSVRPRFMNGSTDVAFILSDGTIIKTRLTVVSRPIPEKTDSVFDFRSKDALLPSGKEAENGLADVELMRALIRGDEVPEYEVRSLIRTITPGFKGVTVRLVRLYTGGKFNGYIFEIENVTKDQRLFLNVQNMMLGDPNLALLSMVDQDVIEPKTLYGKDPALMDSHKTYLRVVAKPTSIYSELKLPIQVLDRSGEKR